MEKQAGTSELTKLEIELVLFALKLLGGTGYYYGNLKQFRQRFNRVVRKLKAQLESQ